MSYKLLPTFSQVDISNGNLKALNYSMILIFFFFGTNCRFMPVNLENIFSKYTYTMPDKREAWRDMGHDKGESSCI